MVIHANTISSVVESGSQDASNSDTEQWHPVVLHSLSIQLHTMTANSTSVQSSNNGKRQHQKSG